MSGPTVLHHMAGAQNRLLATMLTNQDVCSLVMGLLGRIIHASETEMKMPVEGVTIDPLTVEGSTFKARVHFSPVAIARAYIWTPKKEFADYVRMKAGNMARALADNPNLGRFFEDLVEKLIQHAEFKGVPFRVLTFRKHIITKDWIIILELGTPIVA